MADETLHGPEGAAVFPLIPPELGIHPLLLAVLHAVVFFDGSDDNIVHNEAAEESLQYLAHYLQRVEGADLRRLREDMAALQDYARKEKWPAEEITFLKNFLSDFKVGEEGAS